LAKEKCWLQRNWKTVTELIGGLIAGYLLTFGATVFSLSILDEDAIQALIEAEATILGFFGIIFVYILKSLDDRETWCLDRWYDLSETGEHRDEPIGIPVTKGRIMRERYERIQKQRKDALRFAKRIIIFLIASLLFSIFWLGTMELAFQNLTNVLGSAIIFVGVLGIYLLFLAIVELYRMFKQMGTK